MSKLIRNSTFLAIAVITATSVNAQKEEREFGWSLKVDAAVRKKAEVRPSRIRLPDAAPEEIRVDTDLVLSDLLVQDKNGAPISGLKAEDFEISESGSPQKIDVFAYGDSSIPRSIILVIDHSLSQLPHINLSIASAKVLVDTLRPNDRMAVVSDDIEMVSELTSDKDQLKSALESLRVKCSGGKFGKSSQYSALFATLNERISRNGTRNIVIFQTDGDEMMMLRGSRTYETASFGIEDIVSVAERKGVTIYSVYTGPRLANRTREERLEHTRREIDQQIRAYALARGKSPPTKPSTLSKQYILSRAERTIVEEKAVGSIAEETGGLAQALESPDQAADVYERILSDIGRRYLIGYYPPERSTSTMREREVRITLRNKGNFRVVGGRTYLAY